MGVTPECDKSPFKHAVILTSRVEAMLRAAGETNVARRFQIKGTRVVLLTDSLTEHIRKAFSGKERFGFTLITIEAGVLDAALPLPAPAYGAERAFRVLEAILPRRYTNEELGDARERLAKLRAAGASPGKLRLVAAKAICWLVFNVSRDALMLIVSLMKVCGH